MVIGIIVNKHKDAGARFSKAFAGALSGRAEVRVSNESAADFAGCALFDAEKPDGLDVLAVFGGDGSILAAAAPAARSGVPVLGVNLGALGFLTESDAASCGEAAQKLCEGAYTVEYRAMLETSWQGSVYHALNEVALMRDQDCDGAKKVVTFETFADKHTLGRTLSDGLIVSTPTGSTGYALSAGGPVLSPGVDATLVLPICPHSLTSRPIVLPGSAGITVRVGGERTRVRGLIDGAVRFTLCEGEEIFIQKAPVKAGFVRFSDTSFYEKLLKKMVRWGSV